MADILPNTVVFGKLIIPILPKPSGEEKKIAVGLQMPLGIHTETNNPCWHMSGAGGLPMIGGDRGDAASSGKHSCLHGGGWRRMLAPREEDPVGLANMYYKLGKCPEWAQMSSG